MPPEPLTRDSFPAGESGELRETLVAAQAELKRTRREKAELERRVGELEAASASVRDARRAALNVMEDAVESRRQADTLNAELQREVAERTRAEAALREMDRRKNQFLAMLGHELRNPLAAIQAGVTLLMSDRARPEARQAALPVVAQQVAHMARLVDDLLDVTRIAQGKVQLCKEATTLCGAITHAVEMIRAQPEAAGFEFEVRLPAHPLPIFADPVRLTQVFANVLGNALKFSDRSKRIEVQVSREQDGAVIGIRDYGIGISAELLPHVFEPFVQAEAALTFAGGLGLGLTVVRELVTLHGGTVEVASEGAGKGSRFTIRLPLAGKS